MSQYWSSTTVYNKNRIYTSQGNPGERNPGCGEVKRKRVYHTSRAPSSQPARNQNKPNRTARTNGPTQQPKRLGRGRGQHGRYASQQGFKNYVAVFRTIGIPDSENSQRNFRAQRALLCPCSLRHLERSNAFGGFRIEGSEDELCSGLLVNRLGSCESSGRSPI